MQPQTRVGEGSFLARGGVNCRGDGMEVRDRNDNHRRGQGGSTRSTTGNINNIQTSGDSIITNNDTDGLGWRTLGGGAKDYRGEDRPRETTIGRVIERPTTQTVIGKAKET